MTGQDQPVIPAAGSHRPGAVNVRLVCPADVMAAAMASLSNFYGTAWQPSARKPSRNSDGHVLQYGTLIVPVPAAVRRQVSAQISDTGEHGRPPHGPGS